MKIHGSYNQHGLMGGRNVNSNLLAKSIKKVFIDLSIALFNIANRFISFTTCICLSPTYLTYKRLDKLY